MTPAAIFSMVKDIVILGVVGVLIYLLINYGEDRVKVGDFQALQKQVESNSQLQQTWYKEWTDADTQREADLAKVRDSINQQHDPIIVREHSACPVVPQNPTSTSGSPPSTGGTDNGPGVDIRPQVNIFELKLEKAVADCRDALAKWPVSQ